MQNLLKKINDNAKKKQISSGLMKFTFMHLADAFIQNDLQCIQVIHVLSVCVFPRNQTHNLCIADAMHKPLSQRNTSSY